MKIKQKIQNLVAPLYNKVWHGPKGKLKSRIKDWCDTLPDKRRTTLVFALLGAFILTAFLLFGNACYKIGARQARNQIEIEHIRSLDLPTDVKKSSMEEKWEIYENEAGFKSDSVDNNVKMLPYELD